ncbi:MAG: DUF2259 domain-containing protein [Xanthobacteraceae bacterium]|nr:DUF2259 domain-containing protein [Xanthobacteraceae bacterium]
MLKRLALMLGLALTAPAAIAADAYELKVLGFSPDGRYFGFVQYGTEADAGTHAAETFVVDVTRDRFVPGVPLRVTAEMREENPDDAEEIKALLTRAGKRHAAAFGRYNVSKPGTVLARAAAADTKTIAAKHPSLGPLDLTLDIKDVDWPRTSKLGPHKDATPCAREVDWQKGAAFRLTLVRGGRSLVLNDDKTIPPSRFCATGYALAEVHAFDRPDGKVSLAVLLAMSRRGFEGDDRTYLAVTRVIER